MKVYPERQKCAKCRKKITNIVVNGTHCSYTCAGVTPPSSKVDLAPRECKRQVSGVWEFKRRYKSESEVSAKLHADPSTNIYRCGYCYHLHVGHSRPDPFVREKMNRVVSSVDTMGSVLQRMREDRGWTVEYLAKRLKVPQIRIKEIERGDGNARLDIMLSALYLVGVRVVLQER